MTETKLLDSQVTRWNESIGALALISPENQRGRAADIQVVLLLPKVLR